MPCFGNIFKTFNDMPIRLIVLTTVPYPITPYSTLSNNFYAILYPILLPCPTKWLLYPTLILPYCSLSSYRVLPCPTLLYQVATLPTLILPYCTISSYPALQVATLPTLILPYCNISSYPALPSSYSTHPYPTLL